MIGEPLKPKSFMGNIFDKLITGRVAKPYNKIRKQYELKPVKSLDEVMSEELNMIPISKYVVERNPYWEENVVLTGYWYDEESESINSGWLFRIEMICLRQSKDSRHVQQYR